MKKTLPMLLGVLGMAAVAYSPAQAQIPGLSANGAVTSNYVFRGISQSAANPAVQAGLDYDAGGGFAVGTWASSIDFGNDSPIEWDIYGSYTAALSDQFSLSVGAIHYGYPNVPAGQNYNWYEIWGGLSYNFGFFTASGKLYYSPDYVNLSDSQLYYTGGVSIPIAPWLAINGNIGFTDVEDSIPPIIKDYMDWNISLAATFDKYTLTLGYADTDLDGIYQVNSGPFQTKEQFFVMLSFKFP